jgi:hypothetical protein
MWEEIPNRERGNNNTGKEQILPRQHSFEFLLLYHCSIDSSLKYTFPDKDFFH